MEVENNILLLRTSEARRDETDPELYTFGFDKGKNIFKTYQFGDPPNLQSIIVRETKNTAKCFWCRTEIDPCTICGFPIFMDGNEIYLEGRYCTFNCCFSDIKPMNYFYYYDLFLNENTYYSNLLTVYSIFFPGVNLVKSGDYKLLVDNNGILKKEDFLESKREFCKIKILGTDFNFSRSSTYIPISKGSTPCFLLKGANNKQKKINPTVIELFMALFKSSIKIDVKNTMIFDIEFYNCKIEKSNNKLNDKIDLLKKCHDTSNICSWCKDMIDKDTISQKQSIGIPIDIIQNFSKLEVVMDDDFCCFECCYAKLLELLTVRFSIREFIYHRSYNNLMYLFSLFHPNKRLFPSLDWKLREINGGSLSDTDYYLERSYYYKNENIIIKSLIDKIVSIRYKKANDDI